MAVTPSAFPRITNPELLEHAVWAKRDLYAKKQKPRCVISQPSLLKFTFQSLVLSALSEPHLSSWRFPCQSWAIIQKYSLVPRALSKLASSQLLGPWVCTNDSTFLEGLEAPSAHPEAPVWLGLHYSTWSWGQSSLHLRPRFPDLSISWTIKLPNKNIPINLYKKSYPISEWYHLREKDTSNVNTILKYSLHCHHHHLGKESGNLTNRQQPRHCDVHIVDTQLLSYCVETKLWFIGERCGERCIPYHR